MFFYLRNEWAEDLCSGATASNANAFITLGDDQDLDAGIFTSKCASSISQVLGQVEYGDRKSTRVVHIVQRDGQNFYGAYARDGGGGGCGSGGGGDKTKEKLKGKTKAKPTAAAIRVPPLLFRHRHCNTDIVPCGTSRRGDSTAHGKSALELLSHSPMQLLHLYLWRVTSTLKVSLSALTTLLLAFFYLSSLLFPLYLS